MKDSFFPNIETMSDYFFKIETLIERPYNPNKFPGEVLRVSTYIFEEATYHEREVYNIIDLIGELGGVIEILILIFGVLIYPISK